MSDEKRKVHNYEITCAIHIGDREIVFGEDKSQNATTKYFTGWCDNADFYQRYVGGESNDYLATMRKFIEGVGKQIDKAEAEIATISVPVDVITAKHCYPNDYAKSIEGKIVAIKPEVLRAEYRRADCQIYLVTGGFGSYGNARGSAVYCTNLYSKKRTRFERSDVQGELKAEFTPSWVEERLAAIKSENINKPKSKEMER